MLNLVASILYINCLLCTATVFDSLLWCFCFGLLLLRLLPVCVCWEQTRLVLVFGVYTHLSNILRPGFAGAVMSLVLILRGSCCAVSVYTLPTPNPFLPPPPICQNNRCVLWRRLVIYTSTIVVRLAPTTFTGLCPLVVYPLLLPQIYYFSSSVVI